ncbi:MAG: hypothetical protein NVSMB19_06420 [Vulcanimicrobiaceae bacterium]
MKRTTFLSLTAVALAAVPLGRTRAVVAAERVRSVARFDRADRSVLIGTAGACASRRACDPLGGYTLADVI